MKTDWIMFVVIAMIAFVFLSNPASITQVFAPQETSVGVLSDTLLECNRLMAETSNNYASTVWSVAECRSCPGIVKTVPTRCYLGCGEVCPTGAQCNYPQYCGVTCPTTGSTCRTDQTFWDSAYRGCHAGGASAQASYLVMLDSTEVGTAQQTLVERQYNESCLNQAAQPVTTPAIPPSSSGTNWFVIGLIGVPVFLFAMYFYEKRKK